MPFHKLLTIVSLVGINVGLNFTPSLFFLKLKVIRFRSDLNPVIGFLLWNITFDFFN